MVKNMLLNGKRLIIAGPCAAEDHTQVTSTADALKNLGITAFRACLWKPRTQPGFDGIGSVMGAPILENVSRTTGMIVATEVLLPEHARELLINLVWKNPHQQYVFWIGARNQNHLIQQGIADVLKNEPNVYLMFKNQVWRDERHWVGIYEHIVKTGYPQERIMICHRGFMPTGDNPRGYRNIPDYAMAMRVKQATGAPMILDPSHIGGDSEKVLEVIAEAHEYDWDGYMIEVHPNPKAALTDASQQLTIAQLAGVVPRISERKVLV